MKIKSFIFCFCLYFYSTYSASDPYCLPIPDITPGSGITLSIPANMPYENNQNLIGEYPIVKSLPIKCTANTEFIDSFVYWYPDVPDGTAPTPIDTPIPTNIPGIGYKIKVTERSSSEVLGPAELSTKGNKLDKNWQGTTVDILLALYKTASVTIPEGTNGEVKTAQNGQFGVKFGYLDTQAAYHTLDKKNFSSGLSITTIDNNIKTCDLRILKDFTFPNNLIYNNILNQDPSYLVSGSILISCATPGAIPDFPNQALPMGFSLTFRPAGATTAISSAQPDVLKSNNDSIGFKVMFDEKNDDFIFHNADKIINFFNQTPIRLTELSPSATLNFIVRPVPLQAADSHPPNPITAEFSVTATFY
ncbi:MAG: hypothetical protein LBI71_00105 [Enterobacteriaceae bacterium]|jgi:hypothetical protein|nr:hypothetical protein [Enterobacteriaceae bacterium]